MRSYEFLLEKLGHALYCHAKKAVEADNAAEAVDYLEEKGVLDDLDNDTEAE